MPICRQEWLVVAAGVDGVDERLLGGDAARFEQLAHLFVARAFREDDTARRGAPLGDAIHGLHRGDAAVELVVARLERVLHAGEADEHLEELAAADDACGGELAADVLR